MIWYLVFPKLIVEIFVLNIYKDIKVSSKLSFEKYCLDEQPKPSYFVDSY